MGGRPQVEDVAGGSGVRVALEQYDLVAGLMDGQCGGHATGSGTDHGDAAAFGGKFRHGGFLNLGRR
jgi:hypothetical protein